MTCDELLEDFLVHLVKVGIVDRRDFGDVGELIAGYWETFQ